MKNRSHGFTLMELMIVLTLAGVILAIGAPNFAEFRRNNRMVSVANEFLGAIQTSRNEAIKRQVPVSICPSDDTATCTSGPFRGWIAFADPDGDCLRNTPASEPLIRAEPRIDENNSSVRYVSANSTGICISFGANGFRREVAGRATARRVLFCDERGNDQQSGTSQSAARGLEVTQTGRGRVTRNIAEIGGWASDPSGSVACPTGAP